jgi:hypothetical protein
MGESLVMSCSAARSPAPAAFLGRVKWAAESAAPFSGEKKSRNDRKKTRTRMRRGNRIADQGVGDGRNPLTGGERACDHPPVGKRRLHRIDDGTRAG